MKSAPCSAIEPGTAIARFFGVPIPIDHPFWLALAISLPVAVISGVLVYAQGWRIALGVPALRASVRAWRFAAGIGFAFAALVFGILAGLLFSWVRSVWPSGAVTLYAIGAPLVAVLLCWLAARRREREKILPTAIALNALFAIAFGWVLPRLMGG